MSLERIQYSIRRNAWWIIILVVLIIVGLIIGYDIYTYNDRHAGTETPAPTNTIAPTETPATQKPLPPPITGDASETHGDKSPSSSSETSKYILVERLVYGDWETGTRYETYYDRTTRNFIKWLVTVDENGQIQYTNPEYSWEFHDVPLTSLEIPDSIRTYNEPELIQLDVDFYAITSQDDKYGWLNQQLENGYEIKFIRIQHDIMEVFIGKYGEYYRVIMTDRYIILNKYNDILPFNQ